MIRRVMYVGGMALLMTPLFGSTQANADRAEEVFRACQAELEQLTTRCVNANRETAEVCVRRIKELLAEGRVEQAIHLARHCIRKIEERTEHCLLAIRELCHSCIYRLVHLGAPELARRFHRNCEAAAHLVLASARRAIEHIENAFDGR